MGKNIVIFSDGTGQRGGVYVDEERSNVYKLFRATRADPETGIDPADQIAHYDPGLGTLPTGGGNIQRLYGTIYNFISQATGLGITKNIIECYAVIIQHWKPGDRIYLFGFSRGAYTVRCLATVICQCGIPVTEGDVPIKKDIASTRKIAAKAVKTVYQHVSSSRDAKFAPQRQVLAAEFRRHHQSGDANNLTRPNVHPYFVGVFDTVASLANPPALIILALISSLLHAAVSFGLDWLFPGSGYWYWYGWLAVWITSGVVAALMYTHLKTAWALPGFFFWDVVHLTNFRQRFYDRYLNSNVTYARHAISIDERRADFPRVQWGGRGSLRPRKKGELDQLEQIWFAGNHADIGGGYPENESRLSDISLEWMIDAATHELLGEDRLIVCPDALHLHGSADGVQHDETRALMFKFARKTLREPVEQATLHPTVLERFKMKVQQYDVVSDYRPEASRNHNLVRHHYASIPLPHETAGQIVSGWFAKIRNRWTEAAEKRLGIVIAGMYPKDWSGGETEMRKVTPDSAASFIGFFSFVAGLLVAGWIGLVWQILPWLIEGVWYSYPLSYIGEPRFSWVGFQYIVDWLLRLPLTLVVAGLGLLVFWLLGRLSAWLYRLGSEGKKITPSQVHT